jgi:hypothetical protein
MPETNRIDDVEKLLSDEKAIEDRKQALIADLLKQKEAAIKEFDDRLAKLGYNARHAAKGGRSHHKKEHAAPPVAQAKAKTRE